MAITDLARHALRAGPRRGALGVLCAALLALDAGRVSLAQDTAPGGVRPIEISARKLPHFQVANSGNARFGSLVYRGGLTLSSPDKAFGGWSGLVMSDDGGRILLVSDAGTWLSAEMAYTETAPAGLARAKIGPVVALRGRELTKKRDLDAESMTLYAGNLRRGEVLIGFERNHRIGVFPIEDGEVKAPTRYVQLPSDARRMRSNSGFEALAVLRGGPFRGSIIAFSERYPSSEGLHRGWIWVKGVPRQLSLVDHDGFDITDAVSLPDGTLILLERRFRWSEGVKMRLRHISAEAVRPGAQLDGEILLTADLSSQIDNMEGLGVHRDASGETVLTIVSDNNFSSFLQRNLLLQFTLTDPKSPTTKP